MMALRWLQLPVRNSLLIREWALSHSLLHALHVVVVVSSLRTGWKQPLHLSLTDHSTLGELKIVGPTRTLGQLTLRIDSDFLHAVLHQTADSRQGQIQLTA